jgi:hypothetical protein
MARASPLPSAVATRKRISHSYISVKIGAVYCWPGQRMLMRACPFWMLIWMASLTGESDVKST